MNEDITYQVLQAAINAGVREFVVCAGSRNSSFVEALRLEERLSVYYWPEERSAAFFALGRSRLTQNPTAIITTSATAAAELLPAAMEAFYSGVPLLLITADRPRTFRGSGAPQSAEQIALFGHYAPFFLDITHAAECNLTQWDQRVPAHLNVCLEEPQSQPQFSGRRLNIQPKPLVASSCDNREKKDLLHKFLSQIKNPIIIVGALKPAAKEAVAQFLLNLNAPAIIEGISGLREDPRLQFLRLYRVEKVIETAESMDYPIDGVLRIGSVPTCRLWRDLEYQKERIKVCNISDLPFSGLSWTRNVIYGPIDSFLSQFQLSHSYQLGLATRWMQADRIYEQQMQAMWREEPCSEAALMHALSRQIPAHAHVYLGNSLPIREWDLAATTEMKQLIATASRGVSGIDGQISTFLGMCQSDRANWAILGDLTTLYDMMGCWIIPQLGTMHLTIVVINNGGGRIFHRMYPHNREMLNLHALNFAPLAQMWGLAYERWEAVPPQKNEAAHCRLIELVPDHDATVRTWNKMAQLDKYQVMAKN